MDEKQVVICPLDLCGYQLDVTPPSINSMWAGKVAGALGAPPTFFLDKSLLQHAESIETKLLEHLKTHPYEEYLKTIVRLQQEVATLKESECH